MKKLINTSNKRYGYLVKSKVPVKIVANLFEPSTIKYLDGEEDYSVCINCLSQPCRYYDENRIRTTFLPEMPFNNSIKVCPTDAISSGDFGFPNIDQDKCISCGLCISRCITGSINFNKEFKANVSISMSNNYFWSDRFIELEHTRIFELYSSIQRTNNLIRIPNHFLTHFYKLLLDHCKRINGFDNIFVRNLLINLGLSTKIRAIGNNDIRFDLISEIKNKLIVGEVSFNNIDIVGEPRALLDDIAVLCSRYSFKKSSIIPIVFNLAYPNKRSDFYEVITDIEHVLGIEISTISVHLLFLLNLFNLRTDILEIIENSKIGRYNQSIERLAIKIIPEIKSIDPLFGNNFYCSIK